MCVYVCACVCAYACACACVWLGWRWYAVGQVLRKVDCYLARQKPWTAAEAEVRTVLARMSEELTRPTHFQGKLAELKSLQAIQVRHTSALARSRADIHLLRPLTHAHRGRHLSLDEQHFALQFAVGGGWFPCWSHGAGGHPRRCQCRDDQGRPERRVLGTLRRHIPLYFWQSTGIVSTCWTTALFLVIR